jgi:mono/diheme cytochrome c family protein
MTLIRYFILLLAMVTVLVVSIAGIRGCKTKRPPIEIFPDMVRQAKVKAQSPSDFYADGRGARDPVHGTVPVGYAPPATNKEEAAALSEEAPMGKADDKSDVAKKSATMSGPYEVILFTGKENYANTGRNGTSGTSGTNGTNWGNGLPFTATLATLERGRERYQIQCAVCHGATGAGNGIATKYGLVGVASLHQQRLREMTDGEIYNTIVNGKNTMLGYGASVQVPDRWAIVGYIRALQRSQNATIADVPASERGVLQGTNAPATTVKP